jgi:hypothetical protein
MSWDELVTSWSGPSGMSSHRFFNFFTTVKITLVFTGLRRIRMGLERVGTGLGGI